MPAKFILSALVLALVGGGAALACTGNVVLLVIGVLLAAVGAVFGVAAFSMLRDPEAAAERLIARRAELQAARAGGQVPATDSTVVTGGGVLASAPVTSSSAARAVTVQPVADRTPGNREERRAAERAKQRSGSPKVNARRR